MASHLNHKTAWNISKGLPWNLNDLNTHLQNCLNYFLQVFHENHILFELKPSDCIQQYNKEFACCFSKLLSCLGKQCQDFSVCDLSWTDLPKVFNSLCESADGNAFWLFKNEQFCELILFTVFMMLSYNTNCKSSQQVFLSIYKTLCDQNNNSFGNHILLLRYLNYVLPPFHLEEEISSAAFEHPNLFYLNLYKSFNKDIISNCELDDYVIKLEQLQVTLTDSTTTLALCFNLLACCYAKLKKFQSCMVLLRKAISLDKENKYILTYLLNLSICLDISGLFDQSWKVLLFADKCISRNNSNSSIHKLSFVIDSSKSEVSCLKESTKKLSTQEIVQCKTYLAQRAVKTKKFDIAISLYEEVNSIIMTCNNIISSKKVTYFPFCTPTLLQIHAELSSALVTTKRFSKLVDYNSDLSACSDDYNRCINSDKDFDDGKYYQVACALYCCVCSKLFLTTSYLSSGDYNMAKTILTSCLMALDMIPSSTSDVSEQAQAICLSYLKSVKAKVLYNYALVLVVMDSKSDNVTSFLHCAVQFDANNIQLRWDVVKLLCYMNHKLEALQFWCDTRHWDFHMNIEKLEDLQLIKSSELLVGNGNDLSSDFVKEDLAIINELITIYQDK